MTARLAVDAAELPQADFPCGCYAHLTGEWQLSLWHCGNEDCRNWLMIQLDLERCLRQLRIAALARAWAAS